MTKDNSRPNTPRKGTEKRYAEAVEMYRTTDLTVAEIAQKCNLQVNNLKSHLQRCCRSDMAMRKQQRREKVERQKQERALDSHSRAAVANRKYSPALKLIEEGATYEEAAETLGVNAEYLCRWVMKYHADIHGQEHRNQTVWLPEGTSCTRESWAMFGEAATVYCETDESLNSIARRFGLPPTSLSHFLERKFPQAVARRKKQREG